MINNGCKKCGSLSIYFKGFCGKCWRNESTLKNCPKCQSEDIINYPNKKIYCKKCRENY